MSVVVNVCTVTIKAQQTYYIHAYKVCDPILLAKALHIVKGSILACFPAECPYCQWLPSYMLLSYPENFLMHFVQLS